MNEGLFRKGMVLAIVCCFIGAGAFPSIGGINENTEGNDSEEDNQIFQKICYLVKKMRN